MVFCQWKIIREKTIDLMESFEDIELDMEIEKLF